MILNALYIVAIIFLLVCATMSEAMRPQWYGMFGSYISVLCAFFTLRFVVSCRVFKRPIERTHAWIYVLDKWEPVVHCINAIIALAFLQQY